MSFILDLFVKLYELFMISCFLFMLFLLAKIYLPTVWKMIRRVGLARIIIGFLIAKGFIFMIGLAICILAPAP